MRCPLEPIRAYHVDDEVEKKVVEECGEKEIFWKGIWILEN